MALSRRELLMGGLVAGGAIAARGAARRPPNFVFILIDDYGWRDTGYNGSRFYETPNIDRLARSGMQFTNGYSASPVCSPTRAAIMTGKYPARLRLTGHLQGAHRLPYSRVLPPAVNLHLPLAETTIAESLRAAGYRTACIGKWHLGETGFLPKDQGFDVAVGGDEAGSTSSFFYPKWQTKIPLDGQEGDYLTDRLTSQAVNFIRDNAQRPFFLYLPHFAVHTPIEGKPALVRKYDAKAKPEQDPQHYGEYAAMIESVDDSVGRILDTLDELKLSQDTVIVFTADNGGVTSREWKNRPVTSNLPLRSGKGHLYEGGIRVPLLMRWPGVTKAGAVCDEPVLSVDFAPTLSSIAGGAAKLPAGDGRDLTPLLRGKKSLGRKEVFWYYPHYSPQLGRPSVAMRRGSEKAILFFEDERVELYDLRADVGEQRDLAAAQPAKAAEMKARMLAWLKETGAELPVKNPRYDAAREREPGPPMGPIPRK